jgi:hypothetical protein
MLMLEEEPTGSAHCVVAGEKHRTPQHADGPTLTIIGTTGQSTSRRTIEEHLDGSKSNILSRWVLSLTPAINNVVLLALRIRMQL